MKEEITKKIEQVQKHFKKDKNILELTLFNYEGYYIYIRLDELKSTKTYKLSWIDLALMQTKDVEKYVSYEYIPNDRINEFINNVNNLESIETNFIEDNLSDERLVTLNVNVETSNKEKISVKFNKYIPNEITYIYNILNFIFQNLPKKLEGFLYEIISSLTGETNKYEYKKEFAFDLFNDDIDEIFDDRIIECGMEYYDDGSVLYLEKIDDRYFAVVEGTKDYLVIVKYNEEEKKLQLYCNCPCEFFCKHMYAVLESIRNNDMCRFYKIAHKNNTKDLLEKVLSFDYYLCVGIVEDQLEIVNNNGSIEIVPIVDEDNNPIWDVLEDDENESLTKEIENIIKEKRVKIN